MAKSAPTIENRKARFEYFIEDTVEAGVALAGTEVKSLRKGEASIQEAFAGAKQGEVWLFNAYIGEYEGGNRNNHEPRRARKLLLNQREIAKLLGKIKMKGATLIPLKIYFNKRGYAKVQLGVAFGKKQHEKRETIKQREWAREKNRLVRKDQ